MRKQSALDSTVFRANTESALHVQAVAGRIGTCDAEHSIGRRAYLVDPFPVVWHNNCRSRLDTIEVLQLFLFRGETSVQERVRHGFFTWASPVHPRGGVFAFGGGDGV